MDNNSRLDAVFERIRSEGHCCPSQCDDLRRAAKPLWDYLKTHGGPHTNVIVTQNYATVTQDEQLVMFDNEQSSADVAPVRHGHNLYGRSIFECSVCGYYDDDTTTGTVQTYRYCPNCGAQMDGKE